MRVAVTGGAGFLGAAACRALAGRGHEVVALDRSPPGDAPHATARLDVTDEAATRALLDGLRPDAVVHLAALLTSESRADPVSATRVNALGTAIAFAAARAAGVRRVVYASSVAALGEADMSAGDAAAPRPATIYGATKAFAEHLAEAMHRDAPQPAFVGLRLGWVYGPGRERGWRDPQAVIEAALRGDEVVRYPDYAEAIDWTFIDDAAAVIVHAAEAPLAGHHVLNVAGDKRTMAEAVAILRALRPSIRFEPEPAASPVSAWGFANDRLESLLGVRPRFALEDGIAALARRSAEADRRRAEA